MSETRSDRDGSHDFDFQTGRWRWPEFVGMSLRLYNPRTRQWAIYWVTNQTGVLQPPVVGSFADGIGVFEGRDELDGRPMHRC